MSKIPKVTDTGHFAAEVVTAMKQDIGWAVVNHGSVASTPRPTGVTAVYWIGTVTPTNMTSADLYNGPAA